MDMDINALRSLVTVLLFLIFLGIVAWAWSSRNRSAFDEAAALPFQDEPLKTYNANNGGTRE